jgi:hypothetical protein
MIVSILWQYIQEIICLWIAHGTVKYKFNLYFTHDNPSLLNCLHNRDEKVFLLLVVLLLKLGFIGQYMKGICCSYVFIGILHV